MRKVLFVGLLVLLAGCALTSKVGKQFPPDGHYLRVTKASLTNHIPRTLTWGLPGSVWVREMKPGSAIAPKRLARAPGLSRPSPFGVGCAKP